MKRVINAHTFVTAAVAAFLMIFVLAGAGIANAEDTAAATDPGTAPAAEQPAVEPAAEPAAETPAAEPEDVAFALTATATNSFWSSQRMPPRRRS